MTKSEGRQRREAAEQSLAVAATENAGTGAALPAAQPAAREGGHRQLEPGAHGIVTLASMLATIMQALDSTIANVALPRMQGTLSATQDQMTWVLTSYIVAAAIMIPLTGWLAGRFGRRLVFLTSVAGFTFASALCGLAENLPQMVLFRLLQGMCGAALVPLSQATLFDINPPEAFGRAMAMWGLGVTMGPILGPALGGWLTEDYSWRWVFYINLPIGILAFGGLYLYLPESREEPRQFDFLGFLALAFGIGGLQLMLDRGELKDWFGSTEILCEAAISALGFYLFLIHTLSVDRPFLNPALFTDRNFVTANVFIFIVGVVLFATLALLPPMLQNQLNYPVITTGLVTMPRGIGTMCAVFLVGRLIGRVDVRYMMAVGLLLTAASLWEMTQFSPLMNMRPVIESGLLQGFGIGLVYVPLSTVAFTTLPSRLRNEGTAFFNLLRNIGSSIGISVVQALLTSNIQTLHTALGSRLTRYTLPIQRALGANHLDLHTPHGLAALDAMLNQQSTIIAYLDDFKLMMVITLAVIPLLMLLQKPAAPAPGSHALVAE